MRQQWTGDTEKKLVRSRFRNIFGVELDQFLHPDLWSFDIGAFDSWLAPADGQSTEMAVLERYGEDGVLFIRRRLLGFFIQ